MQSIRVGQENVQWLPAAKSGKGSIFKILAILGFIGASVLVFLAAYFPLTYRWSQDTWSDLTIQEIVYHLLMPTEGTGNSMIVSHVVKCLVPALIITAAFIAAMIILKKFLTFTAFLKGTAAALSVIVIANTVASFWKNMDVSGYMENQSTYSSFIDENYVDPTSVSLTFPEQKRNLIYIFLESMENTFADTSVGGAFSQNVIPELTQLSLENENFSGGNTQLNGGVPMTGATWTMGAMFAQTSGLPLNISIDKNAMSSQSEFFPGATTLGDILEDAGYNQTLLLGSDAAFGGRKLYFSTHGNYAMRDYNYYTSNGTLPSDYYVWWGYEDKYLFENAKTELAELSASGEPFNLTMLTVDTHFEDGYVCSECGSDFDTQYSNVYACSSKQVAAFVEWAKTQDWYANTTIVISGDHLTMDSDYCNDVPEDYQRTVYTTVINGAAEKEEDTFRNYSTFDMFPTTLAALGVTIPGNKLALGTNLYSSEKTLMEVYGKDTFNEGLAAKSEIMDNLTAGISTKQATLTVLDYNTETRSVQVIASDLKVSAELTALTANVWKEADQSDKCTYSGVDRGDGTWIFTIPFSDFAYRSGTYTITVRGQFDLIAAYDIASTTVSLSDPEMENSGEAAETFTGLNITDFDYTTGTFTIQYAEQNPANVISVTYAVWKNEDQSDLRWYTAQSDGNGVYSTVVNAFEYAFDENSFNVHVYETTMDGQNTIKATAKYKIQ